MLRGKQKDTEGGDDAEPPPPSYEEATKGGVAEDLAVRQEGGYEGSKAGGEGALEFNIMGRPPGSSSKVYPDEMLGQHRMHTNICVEDFELNDQVDVWGKQQGNYYPGKISMVNDDNTYNIKGCSAEEVRQCIKRLLESSAGVKKLILVRLGSIYSNSKT